jgi:hypothetical protein
MPDRNQQFAVEVVSTEAFEIVQDLEAAWCRFTATDPTDAMAVGNAYATLCQRRKELYHYLSGLEFNASIDRPIKLRFD